MALPNSRDTLKTYCLTKLGDPVIDVNVSNTQIETCIDEAIDIFQQYHSDGSILYYYPHKITSTDITNKYITIESSESIISITKIFQLSFGISTQNMFAADYQIALNDLYNLRSAIELKDYYLYQRHIALMADLLVSQTPIRFNRYQGILYLDLDWNKLTEDIYIVAECYKIFNPNDYVAIYGDEFIREYSTALIKKQWGQNMKKFSGIQLPGGVTLDGQTLYNEAIEDIEKLKTDLRDKWEYPPMFLEG